nr:MAG TPA: hypothetical protein [Caudoviricetes sp.]
MLLTRLDVERFAPIALAAVAAGAWFCLGGTVSEAHGSQLLSALLSAAAISAGFLATALSILLPMGSTELGRRLHAKGLLVYVHRYLRSAIFGCMLLAALCVVLFFLLPEGQPGLGRWQSVLLVGMTVYAATALARVLEILLHLFERMSQPEDRGG